MPRQFGGKPEEKRSLWICKYRWKDKIEISIDIGQGYNLVPFI